MKISMNYEGKGKTFVKVGLLNKAIKGNYKKDVIRMQIKSKSDYISGDMTEEEALCLATGLNNAVVMKLEREKRL